MKDLMKQLADASKSQPTTQQLSQELWNSVQPILPAQMDLAYINHNSHMELIKFMVDAGYKDTHAYIWGIKESLANMTGTTPEPIFEKEDEDAAKRGEKDSMKNFGKHTPRNQPKQNPEPAKKSSAKSSEKSDIGKKKGSL
ncbi:hypothetical protein Hanom_Chr03g00190701 [Helianthus anomalus]